MRFLIYANHLGRKTANATAITIMTADLVEHLKSTEHEVLVVGNSPLVEEKVDAPYVWYGGGDLTRAYKLSSLIKHFKPDIVYAFMRPQSTVLALSTLFGRYSPCYVGSIHNTDNYRKYGRSVYMPYRLLVKKLLERLDFIACPSQTVVEDAKRSFFLKDQKLRVVNNFINFRRIEDLAQEDVDIEGDYIINVGRLEEQKNHTALLRVFKKVREELRDVKLLIVGEGSLRQRLEELIHHLNLQGDVVLLGYQENPWKYMRKAKLFVLTSIYEGSPQVILEAMYLRVPVVSFDIPSVVEQSKGGECAILVKSFDEDAIAQAIIKALSDRRELKDMVEKAYKRALEFSVESFVKKITESCGLS